MKIFIAKNTCPTTFMYKVLLWMKNHGARREELNFLVDKIWFEGVFEEEEEEE